MENTLPIKNIHASKTNPRKRFPDDMIAEMAASIGKVGVLQPILVRPHPEKKKGQYEIVAGECRYRGAKQAELEEIPVVIRELTDIEALELQVLENLHRNDLHPMEEAEGFQQLLKKSQDLVGYTADELAAKIGKSRSYIYASLKLCELCESGREAFYDGKLKRETAILVARIPGKKLQEQALKEITKEDWRGDVLSYRAASKLLQERFTLNLNKAPFDINDSSLVIGRVSCGYCIHRSGNCTEIYPDIESADVCTMPDCFAQKKQAHVDALIASGKTVITGKEALEIAPYGVDSYITNGYLSIEREVAIEGIYGSYAKFLGDDLPEPTILIDKNNDVGNVYPEAELKKKLQEKIDRGEIVVPEREPSEWEVKRQERDRALAAESSLRKDLFGQLHQALQAREGTELPISVLLVMLIEHHFTGLSDEAIENLQAVYGCEDQDSSDFLATMWAAPIDTIQGFRFLLEIIAAGDTRASWDYQNECLDDPQNLLTLLHSVDIDPSETVKAHEQPLYAETISTPSPAAHAQELTATENAAVAAQPEPSEVGDTAAQAVSSNAPPTGFDAIKAKELAKRERKAKQKESATADLDTLAPTANAAGETAAQEPAHV